MLGIGGLRSDRGGFFCIKLFANRQDAGLALLNGLALTGAAAELQFGARPASSVFVPPGPRYAKAHGESVPNRARHRYPTSRQSLTYATAYAI